MSEDYGTDEPKSFPKKKGKLRPNHPPRINLAPTTELEIIHTEDGPIIQTVDYLGTQKDVNDRIREQNERISSLPHEQRTIVEQKYIDKKVS
jgi:hypothetical protein